jgi:alpha-amylase
MWYSWVGSLVSNYSSKHSSSPFNNSNTDTTQVDGLRVDTVKHVQKNFWPGYNKAAGVYCIGEVFDGDAQYTCPYQEVMDGLLNYPM